MNTLILRTLVLLFLTATALHAQEPVPDAWQQRAASPLTGRAFHTAVWTGSEMIVWGGLNVDVNQPDGFNDGARYNPAVNTWKWVTTTGAPAARSAPTAVWTGSEMIVWGGANTGNFNDGGRYNPAGDSWKPVTRTGAPAFRASHTAVWTGSEMIVWGGSRNDGTSPYLNDGARYNPADDTWTPMSTVGAPRGRAYHTAVWTGSEMIVWGGSAYPGSTPDVLNDGGRYDPASDRWTAVSTTGAPSVRSGYTAVWTGSEMIVWGGSTYDGTSHYLNDGGRYNPAGDNWTPVTTSGAPAARDRPTAVWTGSAMIVWGGYHSSSGVLNTGGRYDPAGNSWAATTTTGAPARRQFHTAVWTGTEMIVWGGVSEIGGNRLYPKDTFSYTPGSEPFRITSVVLESGNLTLSFPTLTGLTYTLWRSDMLANGTWTNTGLPTLPGNGGTLTFTVPAPTTGVLQRFFRVQAAP